MSELAERLEFSENEMNHRLFLKNKLSRSTFKLSNPLQKQSNNTEIGYNEVIINL